MRGQDTERGLNAVDVERGITAREEAALRDSAQRYGVKYEHAKQAYLERRGQTFTEEQSVTSRAVELSLTATEEDVIRKSCQSTGQSFADARDAYLSTKKARLAPAEPPMRFSEGQVLSQADRDRIAAQARAITAAEFNGLSDVEKQVIAQRAAQSGQTFVDAARAHLRFKATCQKNHIALDTPGQPFNDIETGRLHVPHSHVGGAGPTADGWSPEERKIIADRAAMVGVSFEQMATNVRRVRSPK